MFIQVLAENLQMTMHIGMVTVACRRVLGTIRARAKTRDAAFR